MKRATLPHQPMSCGAAPCNFQQNAKCLRTARARHHHVYAAEKKGLNYKDAGVDIDAGNELVRRIQKLNPSIGGFSGMVPFGTLCCLWLCYCAIMHCNDKYMYL